jgi:hypothetical protein
MTPCITVGREERGGYFGEESIAPSVVSTLGSSSKIVQEMVAGGGGRGGGGARTEESWSTVVCSGPGEVLLLSPLLLRVVGVKLHKKTMERIGVGMSKRPKDSVLMRRMTMRQEIQRLKTSLIGDELPL